MSGDEGRFTVGVTGHRDLAGFDEAALRGRVRALLARLTRERGACRMLSSIAEGADQLCAEEALALGWLLACPLPFAAYREDFSGEARARYDALLGRAEAAFAVAEGEERDAAYWLAGKYVADHCDALLAVWDGAPQQSACGTASVVEYARSIGREVVVLR